MPCCDTGRNIQKYKGAAASTLQDVTDNGNTTTGDIITTSGYFIGDGSKLTGISGASAAFTLQETSDRGNTTSNVIQFTNTITSLTTSGNVIVAGNVTASTFYGDGSGITNSNASNISLGTLAVARGGTGATTLNNLIQMGTHTTGNYVATITGGNGISSSGATSGESIAHTLSVNRKANGGLVIENNQLAVDLSASAITGTLAVSDGGTNITTYAKGDILIASATNTLSNLGLGQSGYVLTSNSTTTLPEWRSASDIGTTVATLNTGNYLAGGPYNGSSEVTFNVEGTTTNTPSNLVARDSIGDIYVQRVIVGTGSTGTLSSSAWSGSAAKISVSDSTSSSQLPLPFMSAATGDVTLYSDSGALQYQASTGTLSSTQFSGSGTSLTGLNATNINSGTLSNVYGGTGFTSYNPGDLLVGTNTNNLKKLPKGNASDVLTVNSLGNDIEWVAASGGSGSIGTFQQVTDTGNTTSNTVQFQNSITSLTASGNVLVTTGNVTASKFYGDGSGLTSLNATNINNGTLSNTYGGTGFTSYSQGDLLVGTGSGSNLKKLPKGNPNYVLTVNSSGSDIEWVAASGGGSSLWTQLVNNDIYYNTGNVGISNSTTNHTVHLGSNVIVNDTGNYDVFRVNGNVFTTGHFVGDGSYITGIKQIKNETDTDVIVAGDGAPTRRSLLSRFYN